MKKIQPTDILQVFRQLTALLGSGISLMKSLAIIMQATDKRELCYLIQALRMDLESGRELSQSLGRHPQLFDAFCCQLIRIGEQTGNLERSLQTITAYKEKNQAFQKQLRQALLYPALILATTLFTTLFLLLFVVPQFAALFAHFPNQLPLPTRILIHLAFEARSKILWSSLLFSFCLLTFIYRQNAARIRQPCQQLLLKVSPLRRLLSQIALTRFARALSVMLSAGLPLTEALLLAAPLSPFDDFRKSVLSLHSGVNAGRPLSAHLRPPSFNSPLLAQLTRIGEESGCLEQMLAKFADISEAELDLRFNALKQILEPLIIAILGALIGGVVLAMYLPIFRLGTALT